MTIYEAIPAIMQELGAIGKGKRNTQHGFMYRGVDDVMNALNPLLAKYKVFVVPEVLEQTREERKSSKGGLLIYSICRIRFTFWASDGSNLQTVVIGEGMDSGDKATNKAMSIAFKYACFQVFCIPTEEMPDADSDSPKPEPRPELLCPQCGKPMKAARDKSGNILSADVVLAKYGMCGDCLRKKSAVEGAHESTT
ncbi:MAG: ERF family protein [Clostridiales bacterium]|nr:ERF family protein [Clostridiales bacterium]